MQTAVPPVDGYGELARRALGHSEWPADTQPQPRSLAALFSKLDRSIELEWLADRAAVQRTLALTLGCPLELITAQLTQSADAPNAGRVRFEDLPYARPFDFREERLPPGIPDQVTRAGSWQRTWWRAPSGSGRSLAGQWLAARGLASFVAARSWGDAQGRIPDTGPVFLELERADGQEALESSLGRVGLCVAAPVLPQLDRADARPGGMPWVVVESPPLLQVLDPLLAWVAARLPDDGAFDAAAAAAWLRQPIADGTLPSLGAVLGAAGLLDARGIRSAASASLSDLASQFVNQRLEEASRKGSAEAQWLKRFGFDVLVKLAESALTSGDEPWAIARSQDEWIALIPAEFQQSVDTEWVRWSLSRSGGQTTVRDLERALRDVPPGAYRIVRALVEARLLRERAATPGLTLCPEFLKHASLAQATQQLVVEASPFSWGEALLRPHAAPNVLEALFQHVAANDFGFVDSLLELDIPSHPALVVATEASLVCLGLRVLGGMEVPLEYLTGVWNEQIGCLVELPGQLPRPRLLCFEGASFCALAQPAVWALAALALSELLTDKTGAAHPLLRPWGSEQISPELVALLDAIYAVLARPELSELPWALEAFALGGRLLGKDQAPRSGTEESDELDAELAEPLPLPLSHPLGRPTQLVRALLDGELHGALLLGFGAHPLEVRALQAECAAGRVAWPRMAHAIWKSWHARGCPRDGELLLGPESSSRDQLWPHLPAEVLQTAWPRWAPQSSAWPFHCFARPQWLAFASSWGRHWLEHAGADWQPAFELMDFEAVERALTLARFFDGPDAQCLRLLPTLWRRFPAWLLEVTSQRLAQGDVHAVSRLLRSAPSRLDAELLPALSRELSRRSTEQPMLDEARSWLVGRVSARARHWRDAYALLVELESRLARSLKARGH